MRRSLKPKIIGWAHEDTGSKNRKVRISESMDDGHETCYNARCQLNFKISIS